MRRLACIVALVGPMAAVACSSFSGEPLPSGPDASSVVEGGTLVDGGKDDPTRDAGAEADAPVKGDAGGAGCAAYPGVKFCSDFDTTGLTPWTTAQDPSKLLKVTASGSGLGKYLSIPIPADGQPTTAFIYHDEALMQSFRFGVDVSIPKTAPGDYISWFNVDSQDATAPFHLEIRVDTNATFSVYESGVLVTTFGALPTAGLVRIAGNVAFDAVATLMVFSINGTVMPATNGPRRTAPPALRLSVGHKDTEAQGGGEIKVDNVVYDTP